MSFSPVLVDGGGLAQVMDISPGGVMFIGSDTQGAYRSASSPYGNDWQVRNKGIGKSTFFRQMACILWSKRETSPQIVYAGTGDSGHGGGLLAWSETTKKWTLRAALPQWAGNHPVSTDPVPQTNWARPTGRLLVQDAGSDFLFAGTYNQGVLQSVNNGNDNFPVTCTMAGVTPAKGDYFCYGLCQVPGTPATIYGLFYDSTGASAVWKTTTAHAAVPNFAKLAGSPSDPQDIIVLANGNIYLAAGNNGLYRSTTSTDTVWTAKNGGTPTQAGGGLDVTAGNSWWNTIDAYTDGSSVDQVLVGCGNPLKPAGAASYACIAQVSVTAGGTATFANLTTTGNVNASAIPPSGRPWWHAGTSIVLGGAGFVNPTIRWDPNDGTHNRIYCSASQGLFRSTNGGTSWAIASGGMPQFLAHSLAVAPNKTVGFVDSDWDVFEVTDGDGSHGAASGTGTAATLVGMTTPTSAFAGGCFANGQTQAQADAAAQDIVGRGIFSGGHFYPPVTKKFFFAGPSQWDATANDMARYRSLGTYVIICLFPATDGGIMPLGSDFTQAGSTIQSQAIADKASMATMLANFAAAGWNAGNCEIVLYQEPANLLTFTEWNNMLRTYGGVVNNPHGGVTFKLCADLNGSQGANIGTWAKAALGYGATYGSGPGSIGLPRIDYLGLDYYLGSGFSVGGPNIEHPDSAGDTVVSLADRFGISFGLCEVGCNPSATVPTPPNHDTVSLCSQWFSYVKNYAQARVAAGKPLRMINFWTANCNANGNGQLSSPIGETPEFGLLDFRIALYQQWADGLSSQPGIINNSPYHGEGFAIAYGPDSTAWLSTGAKYTNSNGQIWTHPPGQPNAAWAPAGFGAAAGGKVAIGLAAFHDAAGHPILLAATWGSGMWRYDPTLATPWAKVNGVIGTIAGIPGNELPVYYAGGGIVYCYDRPAGVWRSNDYGKTWGTAPVWAKPTTDQDAGTLAVHPAVLGEVWAATSAGLYQLTGADTGTVAGGGITVNGPNAALPGICGPIAFDQAGNLYAALQDTGNGTTVVASPDHGATWADVAGDDSFAQNNCNPEFMVIGPDNRIYVSGSNVVTQGFPASGGPVGVSAAFTERQTSANLTGTGGVLGLWFSELITGPSGTGTSSLAGSLLVARIETTDSTATIFPPPGWVLAYDVSAAAGTGTTRVLQYHYLENPGGLGAPGAQNAVTQVPPALRRPPHLAAAPAILPGRPGQALVAGRLRQAASQLLGGAFRPPDGGGLIVFSSSSSTAAIKGHVTEYTTPPGTVQLFDASGTASGAGTPPAGAPNMPVTASAANTYTGGLATAFCGATFSSTPAGTWTLPGGWTGDGLIAANVNVYHQLYQTGIGAGPATVTGVYSTAVNMTSWAAGIATYYAVATTPVSVTTASCPSGSSGSAYSRQLAASGGVAPYTWALASGSLPAGTSLTGGGLLAGTLTTPGTYTFTVSVTDTVSQVATRAFTVTISGAVTVTTGSLPGAVTGTAYSAALTASGGTAPYGWAVTAGSLPPGMALTAAGVVSGTPSLAGTYSFTVQAADIFGAAGTHALSITVTASGVLTVTTSSLPAGSTGTAYTATVTAAGGTVPYTWAVTAGALPGGLSLSSAGAITGTPTTAGTFTFTVTVTDNVAATASRALSITITATAALTVTTSSLPGGTPGSAYTATLAASGGTAPYTWAITSGALPPGLACSAAGTISGTPSLAGTYSFTVQAADAAGAHATAALSITIAGGGLAIVTAALAPGTLGRPYTAQLTASGGTPPYTWSLASGTLPPGLVLNSDGSVTGTLLATGDYPFTVHVTDSS